MSLWAMSLYGAVMIIAIVILRALLINQLPKKTFLIFNGSISNTFYRTFGIQYLFVNTGKRTKHEYAVQWYTG